MSAWEMRIRSGAMPLSASTGASTSSGVLASPVSTRTERSSPTSRYWAMKRGPRSDSIRMTPGTTSFTPIGFVGLAGSPAWRQPLERPEPLVGLEWEHPLPDRVTDPVLGRHFLLRLEQRLLEHLARHDHDPVRVADDPISGRDAHAPDEDGHVSVREQLPARHAVLRRDVPGKDREVLTQDVLDVANAAVDDRSRAAARRQRGD